MINSIDVDIRDIPTVARKTDLDFLNSAGDFLDILPDWNSDIKILKDKLNVLKTELNTAIADITTKSDLAQSSRDIALEKANLIISKVDTAIEKAQITIDKADASELSCLKAYAKMKTAESYAKEPKAQKVKIYSVDDNNNIVFTTSNDYSALHYKETTEAINQNALADPIANIGWLMWQQTLRDFGLKVHTTNDNIKAISQDEITAAYGLDNWIATQNKANLDLNLI
jgi:hypothetical protein